MAWQDPWNQVDKANALRMQSDAQGINMLSALQGAQTNALQQQQLRTQMDDEMAVREAYKTSAGDPIKLREALTGRGAYKQIQALDKAELDKRGAMAKIGKDEAETAAKQAAMFRDSVAQVADQAGWDALRQSMGERGAKLPAQFDPKVQMFLARKADDLVKQMTPDIKPMDVGGKIVAQDFNPFTNPNVQGAQFAKTNTPGELLSAETARRGQNMTDARAREANTISREANATTYDPERGLLINRATAEARPAMQGGQPVGPKERLTDSQKKELASIDSQQNIIKGALAEVDKTPNAFGTARGLATMAGAIPESMAGKMDSPAQREARSYVFNVVSKVINERAGAAQSAQELARLRSFLPAETDNASQVKDKLSAFNMYLENSRAGYDRPQNPGAPRPASPQAESKFIGGVRYVKRDGKWYAE